MDRSECECVGVCGVCVCCGVWGTACLRLVAHAPHVSAVRVCWCVFKFVVCGFGGGGGGGWACRAWMCVCV